MDSHHRWRYVVYAEHDGPENMAIDEAILLGVAAGVSPPTLRFYGWQQPWVSLGSAQLGADVDSDYAERAGWGVVRRPSGGTAVLHVAELGYSVSLPASDPLWSGDLAESYLRLSRPLVAGLARLGIATYAATQEDVERFANNLPPDAAKVCFAKLGPHEILLDGKKVIGSSQVRRRFVAMQHGVIQIGAWPDAICNLVTTDRQSHRDTVHAALAQRLGCLADATDRSLTPGTVAEAIVDGFGATFGVDLYSSPLDHDEITNARRLVDEKYRQHAWTFRR